MTLAETGRDAQSGSETAVAITVNGEAANVSSRHPHLLAALRDELGIISPKDGCAPSGQCGCCTVLVDGKAIVSCNLSLAKVEGKSIVTMEGLDAEEREKYAANFAACGALQCGFCTPGIMIRTKALVDKKGDALTREDASRHLGAHLCRCTGYVKILDAIEALAKGEVLTPERPGGVGSSGLKYESLELATGMRGYIDDMTLPGMLHGVLRLADHARATVIAIDTTAALAVPGVEAVFTGDDVPGELKTGIIHQDWPCFIPVGGDTSHLGDVLAIVVAEDKIAATEAAELIDVTYEVHRPITDPAEAVATDVNAVWGLDGNVLSRSVYNRGGDVDAALAASAHTVHEVFQTQRIEQAFLEPESTLAEPRDDGTLHVWSGGQGIWDDRNQIATILDVDPSTVSVELVSNGGAFGGKEDMSNQAQTALAAKLIGRPVRCTLTREQSLRIHAKRHPIRIESWAGCDADGKLTALKARMLGDSGPVRVGRDEGARTGRRPRIRPVPRARHRRRRRRRPHQQSCVRCVPRLWGQPGSVRDGRRARPSRREGGRRLVRDASSQRHPPRRGVGSWPDHGRRLPRRRCLPRRDQARL